MTQTARQSACACHFEMRYEHISHPAMQELELGVLGCSYGGTSWTTKSQAEEIPDVLGLTSKTRLLDIGSGTGWPGLYMAQLTACHVTLLDLPIHALAQACERGVQDNLRPPVQAVAASGAAIPFPDGSFDAIEHSDVLCCLPEKLEMLHECRRVAIPGAGMLFYVIAPVAGISGADYEEALEAGPPFVEIPDSYSNMLESSGWQQLDKTDLTREYHAATLRLVEGLEAGADILPGVMGPDIYTEQLGRRRRQVGAIKQGLLIREMYLVKAK